MHKKSIQNFMRIQGSINEIQDPIAMKEWLTGNTP
jgi:hypothetical protein